MTAYIQPRRRHGRVKVTTAIDTVIVLNTTTVVLAEDSGREVVFLSNIADERIDIGIGTAAVKNKGIGIPLTNGVLKLTREDGAMLAINAICASGTKNLMVQSITRTGA